MPEGEDFFILCDSNQNGQDLFKVLSDHAPIGIFIIQDGVFCFVNPKLESIIGCPAGELLGSDFQRFIDPAYRDAVRKHAVEMLKGTRPIPYEYRFQRPDGEYRWAMEALSSITYRGQRAALGYFMDTTERRQAEEDLRRKTAELQEACEKLQQLDALKSGFLSTVSHELRTPLTSILGFSKMVRKKLEELLFPLLPAGDKKIGRVVDQVTGNLDIIVAEGERLTNLINDVLDIAKMEAGKIEWKSETVSLVEVMERAIAATASLVEDAGLTLVREMDDDLPCLSGDRDRLIQTVINLISNAVKFTASGTVTCRAGRGEAGLTVAVADTGIGIALENQQKVFEKFIQTGDTLTDKPKGSGLGLSICREIVEHHGGRIWVESAPGRGSTFCFSLPLPEPLPVSGDPDLLVRQLARHVKTVTAGDKSDILVVDDDPNIRELLRQELESAGYGVREADDALAAIAEVRRKWPDLVILDVMMPGMNGFDLAAVLKADPNTMRIPIVILSVIDDSDRGYRIGVDRYLTKPVNMEDLLSEVESLLSAGQTRRRVMVVDEDAQVLRTITGMFTANGYTAFGTSDGDEALKMAEELKPDMVIMDNETSMRLNVVKTLRFENGLENAFFLLLTRPDGGGCV